MIAADSSVFIPHLHGRDSSTNEEVGRQLKNGSLVLPPVALCEIMSFPALEPGHESRILEIPLLEIMHGYWQRAGLMRALMVRKGFKPKLPDTLIAQSCIDYNVPLLTRDSGFKMFEKHAGLKLHKVK